MIKVIQFDYQLFPLIDYLLNVFPRYKQSKLKNYKEISNLLLIENIDSNMEILLNDLNSQKILPDLSNLQNFQVIESVDYDLNQVNEDLNR